MKTVLASLLLVTTVLAEPYLPKSDQAVLEKLPRGFKPARRANDLSAALAEARGHIELARQTAEPRYLGYAQGALSPWINLPEPPPEVLFLRAIIRQSNHDFDAALRDFDAILRLSPRDRSALLAKIAVLQAQGKILEAKSLCQNAPWLGSDIVGLATITSVASLNGQLASSIRLLKTAIERQPDNAWAHLTLAEMAVRSGDSHAAGTAFERALTLTPDDPYLLTSYSDFLIDSKRDEKAIALLKPKIDIDALLLRLAIVEKSAEQKINLQKRYAATRDAVGDLHAREEAMLQLHLLAQPQTALKLAQANWAKQREPADARILLECALAVRRADVAAPVFKWMDETKIEDVRLEKLRNQLGQISIASKP